MNCNKKRAAAAITIKEAATTTASPILGCSNEESSVVGVFSTAIECE